MTRSPRSGRSSAASPGKGARLFLVSLGLATSLCCHPEVGETQIQEELEVARSELHAARLQYLETAVLAVEVHLAVLQADRDPSWSMRRTVVELVPRLNSTPESQSEETGSSIPELSYTAGPPIAPWTVRLVPLEDVGRIRVEAFAEDLTTPALSREIGAAP